MNDARARGAALIAIVWNVPTKTLPVALDSPINIDIADNERLGKQNPKL